MSKDVGALLMQRGIGVAITELRRRKEWDQNQLAREFRRYRLPCRIEIPTQTSISHWETGSNTPHPTLRIVLAKIADAQHEPLLHEVFAATPIGWRVVRAVIGIGFVVDPEDREQVQALVDKHGKAARGESGKTRSLPWEEPQ